LNKEEALEFKLMQADINDESAALIDDNSSNESVMFELNEDVETETQNASN
jgi:hypothetical protein